MRERERERGGRGVIKETLYVNFEKKINFFL